MNENELSYDVGVIQWITLCYKNPMTACIIRLWRIQEMSLTTSVSTMCFLFEILSILNATNSHFNGSYDKQDLKLMVVSYEIYETCQRLVS